MAARALRLYADPDSIDAGLTEVKGAGASPAPLSSVPIQRETELRRALENFRSQSTPDEIVRLDPEQADAAGWMTAWEFCEAYFVPWYAGRVKAGSVGRRELRNIRGALRAYYDWDSDPYRKIAGWPEGRPWTGLPLRSITGQWIEDFLQAKMRGYPRGANRWALGTVKSRRGCLATVLGYAEGVGAIERAPKLAQQWKKRVRKRLRAEQIDDDADPEIVAYTDGELGAIYAALGDVVGQALRDGLMRFRVTAPRPRPDEWRPLALATSPTSFAKAVLRELRCLIVLCANCGARVGDLLRFSAREHLRLDLSPAEIRFTAEKTGKDHRIPLAEVTVRHLKQAMATRGFDRSQTYLFPHLGNPDPALVKPPSERAPYESITLPVFRRALTAAGLDESGFEKPIHSIRKSCTTRFNLWAAANHKLPIGSEITHGKSADVVSQHYMATWRELCEAVETIGWPAEFLQG